MRTSCNGTNVNSETFCWTDKTFTEVCSGRVKDNLLWWTKRGYPMFMQHLRQHTGSFSLEKRHHALETTGLINHVHCRHFLATFPPGEILDITPQLMIEIADTIGLRWQSYFGSSLAKAEVAFKLLRSLQSRFGCIGISQHPQQIFSGRMAKVLMQTGNDWLQIIH